MQWVPTKPDPPVTSTVLIDASSQPFSRDCWHTRETRALASVSQLRHGAVPPHILPIAGNIEERDKSPHPQRNHAFWCSTSVPYSGSASILTSGWNLSGRSDSQCGGPIHDHSQRQSDCRSFDSGVH